MRETKKELQMMKIGGTFIFLVFLLAATHLPAQEEEAEQPKIYFEDYDPPSSLVVPEHPLEQAKFPFVDVHSHHRNMAEQDLDLLIRQMDSLNMGAIVNLSGRGGEALQAMLDNVHEKGYEDRILLFTNIDFDSIDQSDWTQKAVARLEADVKRGARGLKIFKSLGMRYFFENGDRLTVNHPSLDPIWAKCGELGIPVLIHTADPRQFWEPHDEANERWLELKLRPGRKRSETDPAPWETLIAEQHDVFRRHSGTTFINAHFGWYGNDLRHLGELLDELPNMYIEFGAVIAELGRQPRAAKAFFERYQDRILFGKDAYNTQEYHTYFRVLETADEYFPYYKRYHAFWRMYGLDLSDEVLRKIYYQNAMQVIPGLKAEVFQ